MGNNTQNHGGIGRELAYHVQDPGLESRHHRTKVKQKSEEGWEENRERNREEERRKKEGERGLIVEELKFFIFPRIFYFRIFPKLFRNSRIRRSNI